MRILFVAGLVSLSVSIAACGGIEADAEQSQPLSFLLQPEPPIPVAPTPREVGTTTIRTPVHVKGVCSSQTLVIERSRIEPTEAGVRVLAEADAEGWIDFYIDPFIEEFDVSVRDYDIETVIDTVVVWSTTFDEEGNRIARYTWCGRIFAYRMLD